MSEFEIWNDRQGWCLPPFPELQIGEIALAIQPNAECDEWTVDKIVRRLGYTSESRYLGENRPSDPLLAEVYQFVEVYSDRDECDRIAKELIAGGIPENSLIFVDSRGLQKYGLAIDTQKSSAPQL